jgi:hypothetical protein
MDFLVVVNVVGGVDIGFEVGHFEAGLELTVAVPSLIVVESQFHHFIL